MNREILVLVDALAHEKNVEREIVFGALESAMASATARTRGERRRSGCSTSHSLRRVGQS